MYPGTDNQANDTDTLVAALVAVLRGCFASWKLSGSRAPPSSCRSCSSLWLFRSRRGRYRRSRTHSIAWRCSSLWLFHHCAAHRVPRLVRVRVVAVLCGCFTGGEMTMVRVTRLYAGCSSLWLFRPGGASWRGRGDGRCVVLQFFVVVSRRRGGLRTRCCCCRCRPLQFFVVVSMCY